MKKILSFFSLIAIVCAMSNCTADHLVDEEIPSNYEKQTGYDEWGFNFQAHNFKSYLINAMLGDPAFENMPHYRQPGLIYKGEGSVFWDNLVIEYPYFTQLMPPGLLDCKLEMKWNDDLLNKDGIYPPTWFDSKAWIMFKYKMNTASEKWSQVRKLVAISSGNELIDGIWYDSDGQEIGKESYYWSDSLIIKQVINTGLNMYVPGAMPSDYVCPNWVGFGNF